MILVVAVTFIIGSLGGVAILIVFGDLIVAVIVIVFIIRLLMKKKQR